MPFVKLDCGILNSTLWFERNEREVFLTALLMAEPCELNEPTPQIEVSTLTETGWRVPPGWYGFVPAAGVGIIRRAGVAEDDGIKALITLGSPEKLSRSQDFDGRRLVRIDGGYLVLNFMKYRDRDYTSAERSRRYRARKLEKASRRDANKSHRDITQAEAEAEAEKKDQNPTLTAFARFWSEYPRKVGKDKAQKAWLKLRPDDSLCEAISASLEWQKLLPHWTKDQGAFVPHASTWLAGRRFLDERPASLTPRSEKSARGWADECREIHGGRCTNVHLHEALKADSEVQ